MKLVLQGAIYGGYHNTDINKELIVENNPNHNQVGLHRKVRDKGGDVIDIPHEDIPVLVAFLNRCYKEKKVD